MRLTPLVVSVVVAGSFAAGGALAKAPPNATGQCKDGTYTEAKSKEGACSSHGGVKSWSGEKAAAADRPSGSTGQCKDGTYTDAASKSGACSGHKGVKQWYGGSASSTKEATATKKEAAAAREETPPPTGKQTQAPGPATSRPANAQPTSRPATPAAGGGNGKVWVNTNSKVYHCESDALYGKTKEGEYMTEAQAQSSGARPSRGKTCS